MTYFSSDELKQSDNARPPSADETAPEFLAMINQSGIPPHALHLKVGAICALQRNMSVDKGLVKNARMFIVSLHRRFVKVRTMGSQGNVGREHCLPRIMFTFQPQHTSWTINRRQFPLRLAYATTFNGCQSLTLDKTAIDCRIDPFSHGQLYTALSRIRKREDCLAFFASQSHSFDVANIVYKDLLL